MKFLKNLLGQDTLVDGAIPPKFQLPEEKGTPHNFDYGNLFYRSTFVDLSQRLVIGMQSGHLGLMEELAKPWRGPYRRLFVYMEPKCDRWKPGRYASEAIESFEDVVLFHERYRRLLEGDGCHHYWLCAEDAEGTLVYDHHNVIFAYGDLPRYESTLRERGFREQEFSVPFPHGHTFSAGNRPLLAHMLSRHKWDKSPLEERDDYR